jgi:glutaredoxin 3
MAAGKPARGPRRAVREAGGQEVSGAEVVMYSTGWCGFCARARGLLERKGVAFREIDVDEPEARAEMVTRSGKRSVPQIFIGSRHVGGFEELYALERSGELDRLLTQETP